MYRSLTTLIATALLFIFSVSAFALSWNDFPPFSFEHTFKVRVPAGIKDDDFKISIKDPKATIQFELVGCTNGVCTFTTNNNATVSGPGKGILRLDVSLHDKDEAVADKTITIDIDESKNSTKIIYIEPNGLTTNKTVDDLLSSDESSKFNFAILKAEDTKS